jgi:hypothetical protein
LEDELMRRLLKITLLTLAMGLPVELNAQPPLPPLRGIPHPLRVVRDVDGTVRRAVPVRRRVVRRRAVRRHAVVKPVRYRAPRHRSALRVPPPLRALPAPRLPIRR